MASSGILGRIMNDHPEGSVPAPAPYPSFIEVQPKPVYGALTRLYNVVAVALGLLVLSPLLGVLALAVKLTSPGPILYRGERVGLGERIFTILKFRTMRVGAEQQIGARLVQQDEGHFTPVGRFLRKYRLDELPQLINVLRGDMNLVGPRPLRPIFLQEHKRTIPAYAKRFLVRPGITGQAQVQGGYYTAPRHKLRYEMLYIAHRSIGLDLKLIVLTFLRVMTRVFTTGFILAWLVTALLVLPPTLLRSFELVLGGFRFSLLYVVPAAAGVWLLVRKEVTDGRLYFLRTPLELPWLLFFVGSLGAVGLSHTPMTAFRGTLYYGVTAAGIFYLVLNSAVVTTQWQRAVKLVAAVVTGVALLGLLELVAAWYFADASAEAQGLYRLRSTLGSTMATASLLVLALPLLLSLFLSEVRAARRAAWGLATLLVLSTAVLTFTRSALAGIFVALGLYLREGHRRILVPLALILAVGAYLLSHSEVRRFSPGDALRQAGAEIQRQGELLASLPARRLVLGVGARSLPAYLSARAKQAGRAGTPQPRFRNFYLTLLAEQGLVGFGLFLIIVATCLRTMREATLHIPDPGRRRTVRAVGAGVAGFLVLLLASDGLRALSLQVLFWAALGFGVGLALHARPGSTGYYRVVHFREKL